MTWGTVYCLWIFYSNKIIFLWGGDDNFQQYTPPSPAVYIVYSPGSYVCQFFLWLRVIISCIFWGKLFVNIHKLPADIWKSGSIYDKYVWWYVSEFSFQKDYHLTDHSEITTRGWIIFFFLTFQKIGVPPSKNLRKSAWL